MQIPIWISNRHIHLSKEDADVLFGPNYEFKKIKDLTQPWQFACEEVVTLVGPKKSLEKVRVLWPLRKQTQVEINFSDNFVLWISAPIRMSWDLQNTPWIKVIWPKWEVQLSQWVIVAQRHIHISTEQAKKYNLTNNQVVSLKIDWVRSLVFNNIIVRVDDNFELDCHIDIDEWNSAWLPSCAVGELIV